MGDFKRINSSSLVSNEISNSYKTIKSVRLHSTSNKLSWIGELVHCFSFILLGSRLLFNIYLFIYISLTTIFFLLHLRHKMYSHHSFTNCYYFITNSNISSIFHHKFFYQLLTFFNGLLHWIDPMCSWNTIQE